MRRTLKVFVIPAGKPAGTPPEPGPDVELDAPTEDALLAAAREAIAKRGQRARAVSFTPRLVVNNVRAAVASAVEGHGVARLLSYHVAPEIARDELRIVLAGDEPEPIPIHLVSPYGRLAVPKVRAFVDFALPRLRAAFARLAPPR